MMRGHLLGAQALGELAGHPLDQPARVDKDQGRAVRLDQLGQPVIDLLPDFARHDRLERRGRDFEGEITLPAMACVDDPALCVGSDQKPRDCFDRLLCGRQADPQQRAAAEGREALQRQRQMRTAFVWRQRVDLVDDDGAHRRQHFAAGVGAEQDVERFRRGDDDVRRRAAHALALAGRRVAGAHPAEDVNIGQSLSAQRFAYPSERRLEVALDVIRQRFQRRDIDDLRLVTETAFETLPHQPVDRREKRGQCLARPGGCGDQHMPAGLDRRPRRRLRRGRRDEIAVKPGGDRWMEEGGRVHGATSM